MDKLGKARKLLDEAEWLYKEIEILDQNGTSTFKNKRATAANATRLKILQERLKTIENEIEINDDLKKDFDDGMRKLHEMILGFDPGHRSLPSFPNLYE